LNLGRSAADTENHHTRAAAVGAASVFLNSSRLPDSPTRVACGVAADDAVAKFTQWVLAKPV